MKYLLIVFMIFATQLSYAYDYWSDLTQRYDKKDQKRWTVSDWLSQKKQFNLMDNWLAANRATNFFEMYLSGSQLSYTLSEDGTETSDQALNRYGGAFYLSIFGFGMEQDSSSDEFTVSNQSLYLRLLGTEVQGTHFTVYYGQRNYKEDSNNYSQENPFYGALINLYLFPVFGLEANYQVLMSAKDSDNVNVEGTRSEYGAFFDLYFLRLYGNVYSESITKASGTPLKRERTGTDLGIKLFF